MIRKFVQEDKNMVGGTIQANENVIGNNLRLFALSLEPSLTINAQVKPIQKKFSTLKLRTENFNFNRAALHER